MQSYLSYTANLEDSCGQFQADLNLTGKLQGRNLAKFDHIKNDRQLVSAEDKAAQQADPSFSLKHMSEDTRRVMAKLNSADSATVSAVLLLLHLLICAWATRNPMSQI